MPQAVKKLANGVSEDVFFILAISDNIPRNSLQ